MVSRQSSIKHCNKHIFQYSSNNFFLLHSKLRPEKKTKTPARLHMFDFLAFSQWNLQIICTQSSYALYSIEWFGWSWFLQTLCALVLIKFAVTKFFSCIVTIETRARLRWREENVKWERILREGLCLQRISEDTWRLWWVFLVELIWKTWEIFSEICLIVYMESKHKVA